jgi:hypothetical protein
LKTGNFIYHATLEVEFSQEDIDEMTQASIKHYDATCRAISQVGGFLYGFRNHLSNGIAKVVAFSWQLDLLAKIMESTGSPLFDSLYRALDALNQEYRRLNGR